MKPGLTRTRVRYAISVPPVKPLFVALAALSLLPPLTAAPVVGTYNVRDYGAVPDGQTKNTAAFARAIAAAHAAGGGTVFVPAGRYLTGSIHLESNLTLDLDAGSELLYSGDPADSPLVESRWESTDAWVHGALIYANGKENIAIVGRGILNGQGKNWWWRSGSYPRGAPHHLSAGMTLWRSMITQIDDGRQFGEADFAVAAEVLRPTLVETYECRNVRIDGITVMSSPFWLLHPVYCDNVVVHGVTLISAGPLADPNPGPNGDGIDIDSCRNVRISDCSFSTSDDCIVIKAGRDASGRRKGRPTEFVAITNCVMFAGHGAVVIGSETSGDIRDIVASNIVAKGTDRAVRIKSMRGRGSVVENVRCDNFLIEDAATSPRADAGSAAIEITTLYQATAPEPASERTPTFRNFAFSNFSIINAKCVVAIHGLPERAVSQLRFSDFTATGKSGFICDHAEDVELHNVRVDAEHGSAFAFATTRGLVLDGVTSPHPGSANPVIHLDASDDITVQGSRAALGTTTFLEIAGPRPARLHLLNNELSGAANPVLPADLIR
jgi:polygalacturonase